jgi:hypothetical protein
MIPRARSAPEWAIQNIRIGCPAGFIPTSTQAWLKKGVAAKGNDFGRWRGTRFERAIARPNVDVAWNVLIVDFPALADLQERILIRWACPTLTCDRT